MIMSQQNDLDDEISVKNKVTHEGVVSRISSTGIVVSLKGNISCEGCKAKSACGVSESNDKEIEIFENFQNYQLNDSVQVVLQKELGLKAVFWAYIFPFILMMCILLIATPFVAEWLAGVFSILILVPYYFLLHFFNDSFKKAFKVSILKNNFE